MGASKGKLLKEPWREYEILENGWKGQVQETLLNNINGLLKENKINVVFFGPISSGKSSLINSYSSIGAKRICCRTQTGTDITSHTLHLKQIENIKGLDNLTLYDTMGLEEGDDKGLSPATAKSVTEGGIKAGQMLKNDKETADTVNDEKMKQNCVVYVLDAENIKNGLKEDHKKKIAQIIFQLKQIPGGPNRVVILTHIDCICPAVKSDITKVFESRAVYEAVKDSSEITGAQIGHVFPVKNYVDEQDLNYNLNVLLLLALEKIVGFSVDQQDD